jgi:hypothetical protein
LISAIFCREALVMVATFVLLGTPEPDSMLHSFLDEHCRGRGLGDKGERTIGVHSDDDGDNHAHVVLRALVELLGEGCDVDAVLAQSGADGGRGSRLACGNLQLHISGNLLLCHGVAPPKI